MSKAALENLVRIGKLKGYFSRLVRYLTTSARVM
jgi:hypothetical protein